MPHSSPRSARKNSPLMLGIFGLPFAAVAVFVLFELLSYVGAAFAMRGWVETPAQVTKLELQRGRSAEHPSYTIRVQYTYVFAGTTYQGERVAVDDSANSQGSYSQNLHQSLKDQRQSDTVVCYVDPHEPQSAVLDRRLRWRFIIERVVFIVLSGGVGFALIVAGIVSYRRARNPSAQQSKDVTSDWSSDPRWRDGVIRASFGHLAWTLVLFAVVWNCISWPVALLTLSQSLTRDEPWTIALVLLFPALGLVFAVVAGYFLLRVLKYGSVLLRPEGLPLYMGQWHTVQISGSRALMTAGPVHCQLVCRQSFSSGSRRQSITSVHIHWRHDWHVDAESITNDGEGWTLGLRLPLPSDAPAMDEQQFISWTLEVRVPTTGVDFFAAFPLPVLTAASNERALTRAMLAAPSGSKSNQEDEDERERLYRRAGLRRVVSPNYLRLVSPPLRCRDSSLGKMILGMLFIGAGVGIAVLLASGKDAWFLLIFASIFALIGLIVFTNGFLALLWTYHIEVDRHGIRLRSGPLSPGAACDFPPAVIASIQGEYVYSANGVARCRVVLKDRDGQSHRLTPVVGDHSEAGRIAADIRRALNSSPDSI